MPTLEIPNSELVDKLTILSIKMDKIGDAQKLKSIHAHFNIVFAEYNLLVERFDRIPEQRELLEQLVSALKDVNERLWDLEDTVRSLEQQQLFESDFIDAARQIYKKNDERFAIKKQIDVLTKSTMTEEKGYNNA